VSAGKITLPDGGELTYLQAIELVHLIKQADPHTTHWHFNDCGCCVSLHGPDYSYVIGPDGDATFYAERGCSCGQG
jgi:hypothetical protein